MINKQFDLIQKSDIDALIYNGVSETRTLEYKEKLSGNSDEDKKVLLPDNLGDWVQQSEQELCMRYCGYWLSLRVMPETQNTSTVTVTMPRNNQFTVAALQSIMQGIAQGVQP